MLNVHMLLYLHADGCVCATKHTIVIEILKNPRKLQIYHDFRSRWELPLADVC